MIIDSASVLLLLFFALGSYIQATTGFAFGLIVVSGVSALGLAPIEVTAFAVSVLSLVNAGVGLQGGQWREVNLRAFFGFIIPCLPMIMIGVWLLHYLGDNAMSLLQLMLGVSMVVSSVVMMLQAHKTRSPSTTSAFAVSGVMGGLMGGMFATFGPPITFLMYRQPDSQAKIRATLLSIFFCTGLIRVGFISATQSLNITTLLLCALGFPVVALSAYLAKRYPLPISNQVMRRVAFSLLLLSGVSLTWQGGG
ncbi:TSUP family transporter [Marinomonas sp. IMCC 4694]|uniref:TSUP family transporter n=1 Tax=Marinomonas sp. IMCC 4694 TaxID=2605432 RepID=UPI0011E7A0BC|nr:TSUP family transporter [Marinomonas sp. IMCC 4694]TYL48953.1 sulfite exporter TauE/SafE family protein [Marinomonas sp. IMCC 4694]